MELRDALRERRSVKHFDADHQMPDSELRTLLRHTMHAPTSFNMQNWHFIAVRDQEVKTALWESSWRQNQVRDASVVIVIAGRMDAITDVDRFFRHLPDGPRQDLTDMAKQFYAVENTEINRDEGCRTAGLAGMALMLMAKDMGYDSCPMIGFDPAGVSKAIGLPDNHPPLLLVTVGKAATPAQPRMGFLNYQDVVSSDRFGQQLFEGEIEEL